MLKRDLRADACGHPSLASRHLVVIRLSADHIRICTSRCVKCREYRLVVVHRTLDPVVSFRLHIGQFSRRNTYTLFPPPTILTCHLCHDSRSLPWPLVLSPALHDMKVWCAALTKAAFEPMSSLPTVNRERYVMRVSHQSVISSNIAESDPLCRATEPCEPDLADPFYARSLKRRQVRAKMYECQTEAGVLPKAS